MRHSAALCLAEMTPGERRAYRSWTNMMFRCSPKSMKHRWGRYYFGKGIRIARRWHSFGLFLVDMGERPEGKTLDRVDGEKNYEPGNCRWATKKEQMENRKPTKIPVKANKERRRNKPRGPKICSRPDCDQPRRNGGRYCKDCHSKDAAQRRQKERVFV